MNKLIVIRGPLGVGKSTVARKLAERLNGCYVSIDDMMSDLDLDKAEEGGGIPVRNFIQANESIIPSLKQSLSSNQPVIVDGNFYHQEQLDHLFSETGNENEIFTLKAPVEVCIKRDMGRNKPYGEAAARAVHMMVSRFDAGTVIDVANLDADQVVGKILDRIN